MLLRNGSHSIIIKFFERAPFVISMVLDCLALAGNETCAPPKQRHRSPTCSAYKMSGCIWRHATVTWIEACGVGSNPQISITPPPLFFRAFPLSFLF